VFQEVQAKKLLSATVDAGVLGTLGDLGLGLADVEKLLPLVDESGILALVARNLPLAIIATGYAKGHGFFPSGDTALTYANWGGLAQIGFGQYISNERAIIMIAHIHALAISAAAAFGPQVLGDSLTLLDGEADEEPYGFIPPIKQTGLTPAAEMMNGRMAMVGLIAVVATSVASGQDILDVVNTGVGGLLF
jgi:hypothetical protein